MLSCWGNSQHGVPEGEIEHMVRNKNGLCSITPPPTTSKNPHIWMILSKIAEIHARNKLKLNKKAPFQRKFSP